MKLISSQRRKGKFAISVLAASTIAAMGLTACSEKLDSTGGCPAICTDPTGDIQNETLEAVTLDTSVYATIGFGTENQIVLASRGDTLDTRYIIRFDSLPLTRRAGTAAADSAQVPITDVDSARLQIRFDSSGGAIPEPVTVSIYDVTTTGNDTAVADLAPLFTPARRIGGATFPTGTLIDTTTIPIDDAFLLQRIQTHTPLRIGLQITPSTPGRSVMVRAYTTTSSDSPRLLFRVSPDSTFPQVNVLPESKTPTDNAFARSNLADFALIVKGTPPAPAGFLAVGGIPAQRAYFRFDIPSRLVDSSIVIRATLLLTQVATPGADAADSMGLQPNLVVAGPLMTDPARAALFIAPSLYGFARAFTIPQTTGVKEIELVPAFSPWRIQADSLLPRAIVIGSAREGTSPQQAVFYSTSAATPELRPRLRVSYTPRTRFGTP